MKLTLAQTRINMKHDIASALAKLRPYAQWSWTAPDYDGLEWLDSSQTKPTESEINAEITRLNNAEPMRLLRVERDTRLAACDWTQSRDVTLSNDADWKTYRQSLRDLPASASPSLDSNYDLDLTSVTWPTEPS